MLMRIIKLKFLFKSTVGDKINTSALHLINSMSSCLDIDIFILKYAHGAFVFFINVEHTSTIAKVTLRKFGKSKMPFVWDCFLEFFKNFASSRCNLL